ncbi:MAG: hypothetical protein E7Z91_01445 [Cyanobacteria bacterium SIG30]|nr:hypothetical protein [Cyanobacteria bacterium SIG30]
MNNKSKNSELFLENINALPLWVQQVAYRNMEASFKKELAQFMGLLNPTKLVQEICPKVTFNGKNELKDRNTPNLSGEHYIFLANALNGCTLFEIAVNNFWTLSAVCKLLVRCVELEFIEPFGNDANYSIAKFLAGQIRTGELLKKLGQLDALQLKQALDEQRVQREMGHDVKIAEIMIRFGFIKASDIEILLKFKEDAEKRFIMGFGLTTIQFNEHNSKHKQLVINLQREFKKLDQENRILKARLKKILNINN